MSTSRSTVESARGASSTPANGSRAETGGGAGAARLKRDLRGQGFAAGAAALAPIQRTGTGNQGAAEGKAPRTASPGKPPSTVKSGGYGAVGAAISGAASSGAAGARGSRPGGGGDGGSGGMAVGAAAATDASKPMDRLDLQERLHVLEREQQITQEKVNKQEALVEQWQESMRSTKGQMGDLQRRIQALRATLELSSDPAPLQAELAERTAKLQDLQGQYDIVALDATEAQRELARLQDLLRRQNVELERLRQALRPRPQVHRSPGA